MTRQQAEQFINIYNALLTISTKGQDTKTMSKILEMMEELANNIQIIENQVPAQNQPIVEPSVEGE